MLIGYAAVIGMAAIESDVMLNRQVCDLFDFDNIMTYRQAEYNDCCLVFQSGIS